MSALDRLLLEYRLEDWKFYRLVLYMSLVVPLEVGAIYWWPA